MNGLSLFAGIGGLDLGLERAGITTVGQVEIDPWCRQVLAKHWPDVPRHDDVRTAAGWWLGQERPHVDLVAGGFPCQPVSLAGKGAAQADARWLWPAMAGLIGVVRPRWVVGENVLGLRRRGLNLVVRDLRTLGYRVGVHKLTACALGFPHMRPRLFVVAHTESLGCGGSGESGHQGSSLVESAGHGEGARWPGSGEPRPVGVAYGVPGRVDRLRGLGNAVVPQVAEHIGRLIVAADQGRAA